MAAQSGSIRPHRQQWCQTVGILVMMLFVGYDLYLNATADFDATSTPYVTLVSQILSIMLVLVLFLMLAIETHPCKVGLVKVFWRFTRVATVWTGVYLVITVVETAWRTYLRVTVQPRQETLWRDYPVFFTVSIVQKIVAVCYYAVVIRTTFRLSHPKFQEPKQWIRHWNGR